MQIIFLSQNKFTVVDDSDYNHLIHYTWCAVKKKDNRWYAKSSWGIFMHRMILNLADSDLQVDHISGDGLDNRRENLRICTNQQNTWNQSLPSNNISGFRGVSRSRNRWRAIIRVDYRKIHLGVFRSSIMAAIEYDKAALQYYGEFARLNFPKQQ